MEATPAGLRSCLDVKESETADCYLPSTSDRQGYVVFSNYRGCFNSWLAPPGFMLLPTWCLAVIYLMLLVYMFVGVALASDRFMASIEVICSATRKAKRRCPVTGEVLVVHVPVWNWVVANVSLMAVGSSAPEILLAVVESILRLGKPAGELGPSTIVGSAAYNLLMIAAVCTASLPTGVIKHVKHLRVFVTTAVISMWAYVWMLIVYLWWTPNEVTIVEALLTLAQFAGLLVVGWAVDVRVWRKDRSTAVLPLDQAAQKPEDVLCIAENSKEPAAHTHGTANGSPSGPHLINQPQLAAAWRQQFVDAIEYDSKAAEEGEEPGGPLGLIMHFLSIFWKLLMATVPPEWWLGGWPCFVGSLVWIIAQVVLVDEIATLLGCVLGLSTLVIGMSLVAMGTSVPDTFCSRVAALKDEHADAAIGNVTGSNAANVFLGLGLPWLISSSYYTARGERFCSDAGVLGFSVLVFACTAVVWLSVLFARRAFAGGELGAHSWWAKWGLVGAALTLWVVYLTLTGLVSSGKVNGSFMASGSSACFDVA